MRNFNEFTAGMNVTTIIRHQRNEIGDGLKVLKLNHQLWDDQRLDPDHKNDVIVMTALENRLNLIAELITNATVNILVDIVIEPKEEKAKNRKDVEKQMMSTKKNRIVKVATVNVKNGVVLKAAVRIILLVRKEHLRK